MGQDDTCVGAGARGAFEIDGFDAARRKGWSVLVRAVVAPMQQRPRVVADTLPSAARRWAVGQAAHELAVKHEDIERAERRLTGRVVRVEPPEHRLLH